MDWSTVVILAVVTCLDGVRRVPARALVLRRLLGGPWIVTDRETEPGLRLVSWWSPFSLALVIPIGGVLDPDATADQTQHGLEIRLASAQRVVGALRVLGALVIVGIVFGVPAAIARFDAWGLAGSLGVVMLVSALSAAVVAIVMQRAGRPWRQAMRIGAPLLYPFTAPRAAETVLLHAVAGAAPLMVARQLLGPERFAAWVRPHAYDALRGAGSWDSGALVALVGRSDLAQIVRTAPAHCATGERFCPRCARVYRAETAVCADCQGLPLTAYDTD
jgi:hypothetical protein